MISCADDPYYGTDGCHGGSAYAAFQYIKDKNITDETCAIYQVKRAKMSLSDFFLFECI